MLTKVLLALGLALLIALAAYGTAWVLSRAAHRMIRALPWQRTWQRLRNPWEQEDAAWEELHQRVNQLDPELLPEPEDSPGPEPSNGS